MTPATEDWLTRNVGFARVQLGEAVGALLNVPSITCKRGTFTGPVFVWFDHERRVDVLPWAEAVAWFGAPRGLM